MTDAPKPELLPCLSEGELRELQHQLTISWGPIDSQETQASIRTIEALRKIRAALPALLAVARHSVPGEGWRPIETAPKDGTAILVAQTTPGDYEGRVGVGWCWHVIWNCSDYPGLMPTHWRPLPDAPKALGPASSKSD